MIDCTFNFQLLPVTEGFLIAVPLNAFTALRCTDAGIEGLMIN